MSGITTVKAPVIGGEGYVLYKEESIPTSSVWRLEGIGNITEILFNDQASRASQYGSVYNRRDTMNVPYTRKDVTHAFMVASRGYMVDLEEFCQTLEKQRAPKEAQTLDLSDGKQAERPEESPFKPTEGSLTPLI